MERNPEGKVRTEISFREEDKVTICAPVTEEEEISMRILEANVKWNSHIDLNVPAFSKVTKVSFNRIVRVSVMDETASRESRRSEWEQIGRDRARFERRIVSLEPLLSNVLKENHRDKYGRGSRLSFSLKSEFAKLSVE